MRSDANGRAGNLDMRNINLCQRTICQTSLVTLGFTLILTGCQLIDREQNLHRAANKGQVKAAKRFMSDGVSVDAEGPGGMRPLHYAIFGNKTDMVAFLIDQGADVNAKDNHASTPLHGAAWKGNAAVAALLITRGANVNTTNERGMTPLDWAIEQGHSEMATLIRKHGGVPGEQE